MNAVTKRPYSGGNIIFLWAHGYATQRFLTFKQAFDAGGSVRKGEHGTKVFYVSKMEKTSDDGEKLNLIPLLKEYTVSNIVQCHGQPEEFLTGEAQPINLDQRNAEAQEFIAITGADFREGGEAYYAAGADYISMPHFDAFKDADCFYATSFHEFGHWTAHKSHFDRDLKNRFGSRDYAAEALAARFWPQNLGSIKRFVTPATLRIGSSCSNTTTAPFSRPRRKRKKPLIICVGSPWRNPHWRELAHEIIDRGNKTQAPGQRGEPRSGPRAGGQILQPGWQCDMADNTNRPKS